LNTFSFSQKSLDKFQGVDIRLVALAKRALQLSTIDFVVNEGLRSKERQASLVKSGASKTLNSKHLDGLAIDLVPFVNGQLSWDWSYYYTLAEAVKQAAIELDIPVVWGGCWDKPLQLLGPIKAEVEAYVGRRKALGKSAFIDGPHFELIGK
jgi:peptidoglycan L-alanyl-D-glutamate endopeptidase CwlK